MSEHEQHENEDQETTAQGDESGEDLDRELEEDPAYAGGEDQPADELRGG